MNITNKNYCLAKNEKLSIGLNNFNKSKVKTKRILVMNL